MAHNLGKRELDSRQSSGGGSGWNKLRFGLKRAFGLSHR